MHGKGLATHCDLKEQDIQDKYLLQGNITKPETRLLDERDPSIDYDDIYCKVMHGKINKFNDPQTKGDDGWVIQVIVRWNEPGESLVPEEHHYVYLDARMVPAGI